MRCPWIHGQRFSFWGTQPTRRRASATGPWSPGSGDALPGRPPGSVNGPCHHVPEPHCDARAAGRRARRQVLDEHEGKVRQSMADWHPGQDSNLQPAD